MTCERILGSQLCCEGILTQRQIFIPSTQESLSISLFEDDVHLELPLEVLDYPDPDPSIEAAFAPLGPIGPQFIIPDGMIPVSSAVWLCSSPYKKFQDPAVLKLSHCFKCNSPEDSNLLSFLKAEHKDIIRDEYGQLSIKFEEVAKAQSEFPLNEQYGILRDHHFCMYCLAVKSLEKDVLGRVSYCLTILKPKLYPTNENKKIYCILHFDLDSCKRVSQ